MANKNVKTVAKNLASQNEFDILKYRKIWNGNYIFYAAMKINEGACTGYPKFIIVDNENNARFASHDETLDIMEFHDAGKDHFETEATLMGISVASQ